MQCSNCGATHSCGCKARKASDGKSVCTKCVNAYEKSIGATVQKTVEAPVITKVTYSGPGQQLS